MGKKKRKNRGTKTLHKLEYNNNNNNNNNNNTNNNNNNNTNNNNNNNNNSNSNSNNKAVEAREILSQQVNVSDHGTVESGIDSGIHDSRVSDSGNLENATVESLSKFRMQNNNVRNIHDLSQSTESIQSGNRKKTGKRGKKKENGSKDNLNEHEYSHFSNINQLNNQKSNASVDNNYDYKGSSEWHTSKREYSNEKQNQIDDNGSVHRSNKNIFQAKNSNSPNRKKGQSNGFERRSNGHTVDNNSTHDRMSRNSLQKPFKKHETLFHNDRNQDGYINKFSEHRGSRFGLTSNSVSHHNKHDRKYSDSVIEEIKGDLFTAGEDYSLAHCVAEDFRMGAGIAVQFKKKFGGVGNLLDQRKKVGEVAFLQKGNRYIYYLITKRLSNKKPTIETIQSSIEYLRKLCEEHNVKKLAMPTIGCGLDRLRWDDVKKVLYSQFKQTDIRIQVYRYEEDESPNRESTITKPKPVVRIKETPDPLVDIESNTAFVVYGSLNGDVDKTCNQINTKYPFIKKYVELCKESKLELGDIIPISSNREYVCVFLVKKNSDDNFHFTSLERCIQQFNKFLKKENYSYVGIEMVDENDDFLINDKIITIFRNLLSQIVELWICGKKMN